jgi:hypothetical protein
MCGFRPEIWGLCLPGADQGRANQPLRPLPQRVWSLYPVINNHVRTIGQRSRVDPVRTANQIDPNQIDPPARRQVIAQQKRPRRGTTCPKLTAARHARQVPRMAAAKPVGRPVVSPRTGRTEQPRRHRNRASGLSVGVTPQACQRSCSEVPLTLPECGQPRGSRSALSSVSDRIRLNAAVSRNRIAIRHPRYDRYDFGNTQVSTAAYSETTVDTITRRKWGSLSPFLVVSYFLPS